MKIELTKKELVILHNHLMSDLSYGVEGTFGDGENIGYYNKDYNFIVSDKEYKIAKDILTKLGG